MDGSLEVETAREEVEEAFEAAEAVCARRAESSRVRRLTCKQEEGVSEIEVKRLGNVYS